MRYSIHQLDATTWELRDAEGKGVGVFTDGAGRTGYDLALLALGERISTQRAEAPMPGDNAPEESTGGILAEGWVSDQGIAFSRKLAGGRDFTNVEWSWRDPTACLVPLMFQTENEGGHWGAELVGFFEGLANSAGTISAHGRFYDTEIGQQARDTLLDGRRFGVSVDPTEAIEAEYDFICTGWDDDGFCNNGEESIIFSKYEIGGMTMTPFPAFEEASIVLAAAGQASARPPVRASLSIPTAPPREWFELAEPKPGVPFLDIADGSDVLVEQTSRAGDVEGFAVPITIRDDGLVYGHLTYWGQCHTGNPWGPGLCAAASRSENDYRDFHAGQVQCADGQPVSTGRLVVGCEHSDAFDVTGVRDHMAQAGMGWASVRVVDGNYGPWLCGTLEPSLTESQVRMLRSLSLSGEWVGELGGILAVNASGLPVQREKIAASFSDWAATDERGRGKRVPFVIPQAKLAASVKGGAIAKLVGGNMVRSCPECAKRAAMARANGNNQAGMPEVMRLLHALDLRTKHLIPAAAEAARARISPA